MFDKINELQKQIGDSSFYKLWFSPLINVVFSAVGNTAGIWVGYILIEFIFSDIWDGLKWPGLDSLVSDGVLLIISFSFLTSVLYQSTRRLKFNFFNITSLILLVIVSAYYVRVIAIEQADTKIMNDKAIYGISTLAFVGSLILLYISLVWERYVQQSGNNARINRNNELKDLKDQFV